MAPASTYPPPPPPAEPKSNLAPPPPPPPPPSSTAYPPPPPKEAPPTEPKSQNGNSSRTPLSIDEMLKRKRIEEESRSKPKFLSKEERARLAIERRTQQVQAQKTQQLAKVQGLRSSNSSNGHIPDNRMDIDGTRSSGNSRNADRYPSSHRSTPDNDRRRSDSASNDDSYSSNIDHNELASMRARYMGLAPQKIKKRRLNDRKFVFDWSEDADTSSSNDVPATVNVAFGRGHFGGFDLPAGSRSGLDRHWTEKELIEMTERDWRICREDFNISTKGGSVPPPLRNWEEANLPPSIIKVIKDINYTLPTPIQRQAIPIGLNNRDIIGIAETGSGKTAAFIIPILVYIQSLPPITDITRNDGPYAIVLAPTRELAQQIEVEAKRFATPMGFTVVSIVGGHALEEQVHNLRNGAEIVIATPGRLVDCLEKHVLVLSQCNYVVMDEADRMIDLGFEQDVQKVLDALPLSNVKPDSEEAENPELMARMVRLGGKKGLRYRQTVMFSATMPSSLERLARKYMRRPATVIIGNVGQAVDTVEQRVIMVSSDEARRKQKLTEILNEQEEGPIIVFVNERRSCEILARDMARLGWNPVTLYGNKTQDQREAALTALREKKADALVATDLAGRGIDVPDVKLVLNYNMAKSIEDYVHRIGRTGRAGKKGVAITFLGPEDTDLYYDLKQALLKSPLSHVPEELRRHEAAQRRPEAAKQASGDKKLTSLLGDRPLPPGFEALGATQSASSRYTPSPLVLPRGYRRA